jgi:AcrR family transcriptional regulator
MADTKQTILTKALELIKDKGFDQVTLNDICAAAEVSKHTFYYYFKSKEALLLDFFEIPRALTASRLSSILSAENHIDQFWSLIEPATDFFVNAGPEITRRIIIANVTRDIGTFDTSKYNHELARVEISLLAKAYEKGEIRNSSDPIQLLHIILLQSVGLVSRWCMVNGIFDLRNAMRVSVEVALDIDPKLRKGIVRDFSQFK